MHVLYLQKCKPSSSRSLASMPVVLPLVWVAELTIY